MRKVVSHIIRLTHSFGPLLFLITLFNLTKSANAQEIHTCNCESYVTINFTETNTNLTSKIKRTLDSAILTINKESDCVVKVIGTTKISCGRNSKDGQRAWDRVNFIVGYLIKKGIPESRIIFQFGDIEENSVEVRLDADDMLKPPIPSSTSLRRYKS